MRRRKLLTCLGTGIAASCTATTVSGKSSEGLEAFRKHIKQAATIEEKDGEEAKKDFLRDKGYGYGSKEVTASFSTEDSDGDPTIQVSDPQNGGIKAHIDGYLPRGDDQEADLAVLLRPEFKFARKCSTPNLGGGPGQGAAWRDKSQGRAPKDAGALMWNSRQNEYFELANGGGEDATIINDLDGGTEWAQSIHSPSVGRTGFKYSDVEAFESWKSATDFPDCSVTTPGQWGERIEGWYLASQAGVFLEEQNDWSPDERVVSAAYTYSEGTVGVSPTLGYTGTGPTVGFSPNYAVNEYPIKTEPNGENLEIHQSEISY